MSVVITARIFWTKFPKLSYVEKDASGVVNVSPSSAKIVMLAIGDSADDFGENSYNSFDTLSEKSSLERRSVIRVVRALIEGGYISISGLSVYGTNNFKIHKEKLGQPPEKRAKNGRPKKDIVLESSDSGAKSGDSGAESSDSKAKSSDSTSPDPSLSIQNPSLSTEQMKEITEAANKEVDFILKQNQLSAGKSWTKLPEIYHGFGKVFCAATQLTYQKKNLYVWMTAFDEWMAEGFTPKSVLDAVESISSEGKAGMISSPASITYKLRGMKVASFRREISRPAAEQSDNVALPAWMKADYENVG